MELFRDTNVCLDQDKNKFSHSSEIVKQQAKPSEENIHFFSFKVPKPVMLDDSTIGVSVYQMGNILSEQKTISNQFKQVTLYHGLFDSENNLLSSE